MKKTLISLCAVLLSAVSLSSCLSDSDESENTYTIGGYYTITGSVADGYKLYSDFGGTIVPTTTSVVSICGTSGFGSFTRGMFYFTYTLDQVSADGSTITNAELSTGTYMSTSDPMTLAEAESKHLADSATAILDVAEFWAARGYLNFNVQGYYGLTEDAPSCAMVYDPASISDDAITVTLYYNAHCTSFYSYSNFYYSYPLSSLLDLIPGSGNVTITIQTEGCETEQLNVARSEFVPDWK